MSAPSLGTGSPASGDKGAPSILFKHGHLPMGCDIHYVIERKLEDGVWIGIASTDYSLQCSETALRNYEFFAALAGVRGNGPEPLGPPEDCSSLTRHCIECWNGDGHSYSFLPLEEFYTRFVRTHDEHYNTLVRLKLTDCKSYESWQYNVVRQMTYGACDTFSDSMSDFRVVFWFDN